MNRGPVAPSRRRGPGGWTPAFAAAICGAALCAAPGRAADDVEPRLRIDTVAADRALATLRDAWLGELDELTTWARTRATAEDCYDFAARPNLPYIFDNFGRRRLAEARIDTVVIVDRSGHPLFWRRSSGAHHRGFADAEAFLAELKGMRSARPAGVPSIAGAVLFSDGPALVVAMPIAARARPEATRGWLVVARDLDAAQWHRYLAATHPSAEVIDRLAWPSNVRPALDQPLTPVVLIEPAVIRGFLGVPDFQGNAFRAFTVAVPRPLPGVPSPVPGPAGMRSAWLPAAATLALGFGVAPIVVRRRRRSVQSSRPGAASLEPLIDERTAATVLEPATSAPFEATGAPAPMRPASTPAPVAAVATARVARLAIRERSAAPPPETAVDPSCARHERLRAALAALDVVFRYQPQVDLGTGRVNGVEALVFLKGAADDPAPTALVSQLEAAGLGLALAERWLQDVCAERRMWRRQIGHDFPVSLRVSEQLLDDPRFLPLVYATLSEYELPSRFLELEVPEAALTGSAASLAAAREAGLLIAIDDFRGVHSSLQSLASVSISKLRVRTPRTDGGVDGDRADRLLDAILGAARGLDIPVCATGVESPEQVIDAERRGCRLAQGSALGPPVDGDRFLQVVTGSGVDTANLPLQDVADGLRRAAALAAD